jgi:hypothetical protein
MKKNTWISVVIVLVGVVGLSIAAQSFTDVNTSQYWGKTGIPALTAALKANFDQLDATGSPTFANVTVTTLFTGDNATLTGSAIKMTGLPTSTNGLVAGDLWDSSGTLSVVQ